MYQRELDVEESRGEARKSKLGSLVLHSFSFLSVWNLPSNQQYNNNYQSTSFQFYSSFVYQFTQVLRSLKSPYLYWIHLRCKLPQPPKLLQSVCANLCFVTFGSTCWSSEVRTKSRERSLSQQKKSLYSTVQVTTCPRRNSISYRVPAKLQRE